MAAYLPAHAPAKAALARNRTRGARMLATGLLAILGAGVATYLSYRGAAPGHKFRVAAGAFGLGAVLTPIGLIQLLTGSSLQFLYQARDKWKMAGGVFVVSAVLILCGLVLRRLAPGIPEFEWIAAAGMVLLIVVPLIPLQR
ncbi:hypothetical protein FGE12_12330 [Aggregicoccus sp. 17bor-14]|uniref:hypothetical protein n=1 Tax=Myxococcaceae TaxID=31 RepID=UPI00129C16C3|nr:MULTISPECIES: hypothetical protein [Myxococcaceae]MBF5043178.1 hypothetical protein [Simulacricoccus sp. 17bor-14]MRI88936.1 hypothetical protein [Aggregicoccus sp. 17bor-14]